MELLFVYKDIFTGEITPKWENDTRHSDRHFNYDEVLLVCYNTVAEVGCYLKQLHGKPNNIWDCYVENLYTFFGCKRILYLNLV